MTNKNLNITVHMDGDICYTTLSDTNYPALYHITTTTSLLTELARSVALGTNTYAATTDPDTQNTLFVVRPASGALNRFDIVIVSELAKHYQVYADVDLNVNMTPMQVTATCNVPFTPAWARYIATDKDGTVKAFSHRPITDPDQSPPTRWVAQKISTLTTLSTVVDRQAPFAHDSDEWLTTLVKLP